VRNAACLSYCSIYVDVVYACYLRQVVFALDVVYIVFNLGCTSYILWF
jgi:hypothetical protein